MITQKIISGESNPTRFEAVNQTCDMLFLSEVSTHTPVSEEHFLLELDLVYTIHVFKPDVRPASVRVASNSTPRTRHWHSGPVTCPRPPST